MRGTADARHPAGSKTAQGTRWLRAPLRSTLRPHLVLLDYGAASPARSSCLPPSCSEPVNRLVRADACHSFLPSERFRVFGNGYIYR